MIIECPYCEASVDCKELASIDKYDETNDIFLYTAFFKCILCNSPLLGEYAAFDTGEGLGFEIKAKRLWPQYESSVSNEIPKIVRNSIIEAKMCFKSKAYSACAVMCGRALEGICKHFKTKKQTLGAGLKELLDEKIIDSRLFEWGEALRDKRNLGAHATNEIISRNDASYILDFTFAICDYIFILNEKFKKFMSAKEK